MAKKQTLADAAGEPGDVNPAKLPISTRNFILPGSNVKMTIVHDPNAGTYTETLTAPDCGKTVTVHKGISHAWARFEEVKAK